MKKLLPIIALLVLSACNPITVGDSVSNMSRVPYINHSPQHKINAADGRGAYNGGVNGESGTGLQAIQTEVANVPVGGWLVVQIGGNNMHFTANQRAWFIMQVVGVVPDNKCLAWVTPYVAFQQPAVDAWAASVVQYVPNQPCHAVIRWDLAVAANPGLLADFAHPNAAGKEVLACLIATATGTAVNCT